MSDICGDNRFEIIAEAKSDLLEATNINDSPEEMAVLDSVLFRCWQMGWLRKYELNEFEWCTGCKEYDQEKHCCHRWTKVIRRTVEEMKSAEPERKKGRWLDIDAVISLEDGIMKEHFDNKEKDPNAFRSFATALALKIFLLKTYAKQNHDVLRGEWVTNKDGEEMCSVCWTPKKASELHGMCVYCGAEMTR